MSANSCPLISDNTAGPGTETLCWATGGFANITIEISGIAGGAIYDVVANPGGVILQTIAVDGVYPFVVSAYSRVCLVINNSGTGTATVNALLFNKMSFSENNCSIDFDATATPVQAVNCWDVVDFATFVLEVTGLAGGAEYEVQANPGGVVLQTITVDGTYIFDVSIYAEICVVLTVSGTGTTSFDAFLFTVIGTGTSHNILLDNGPPSDDHPQYLHLPGRVTGQLAHGGTAAGEELELRGSVDADRGIIRISSPQEIDYDYTDTPFLQYIDFNPVIPSSGASVGGFILSRPDITIDNGLFIFSTVRDIGIYNQTVTPGFAVHTVFLGQPRMFTDTPGVQPNQSFMFASQAQYENDGAGALGTPVSNIIGVTHTPQLIVRNSGDTLSATNITGIQVAANYSTVPGSSVAFGTIRGVLMSNPSQGLFQPGGGAESMTALYGLDVPAIPFGGNVFKTAVRSALVDATLTRFIWNIGTAQSEFGAGDIHLNDNTAVKYGNILAAPDMMTFWNTGTSALRFSPFFGTGGAPLDLRGTAADEWIFQQDLGLGAIGLGFNVNAVVFGTTLPTPNSNNWFVQFAAPNLRQVQIGGEYSDVLWTAGGAIDVNGLAVSDLNAFKINSPAVILNGGTIQDISNLYVSAMPSFGATRTQALRVLGRGRIDGHMNHGSLQPAQITANQNDYQLGANNNQRSVNVLDSDAAYNITGIDSSFGRAQLGDLICLLNEGAFNLTLTHQDVLSLAANRFLSPTGVAYVIGPDECAWIWKDDTGTDRWRILHGTGA